MPVGLLMNFNVQYLKQGIRRVVARELYVGAKKVDLVELPEPQE